MPMETVVAVATGILAMIFLGSLVALIVICRHKYCHRLQLFTQHTSDLRPDVHLISNKDTCDMELDDVRLHPDIEKILADEQWVDDATGLIPHCLAILKKCHHLTERLVAMTMSSVSQHSQQQLWEIIEVARKISPRVDDVVKAMYPPLDPRLLEARSLALVLSVSHLALVTRYINQIPSSSSSWIEDALADLENHVQVLREAGLEVEAIENLANNNHHQENSVSVNNSSVTT